MATRQKDVQTRPGKTSFELLYRQLNDEQRLAVDTIDGVVMVLAGPGTGKTQLLAMRVAAILLKTQMNPQNVLCLTFTESGVAALRRRLLSIIGEAAYQVQVHTFHSFCHEVIQEWPEIFSFAQELEVLSDIERVQLFQEIVDELPGTSHLRPFGNPYLFVPDITRAVQQLKQEHITPQHYQAVLAELAKLLKVVKSPIEVFAGLKPKERTEAQCEQVYQAAVVGRDDFPRLGQYFVEVDQLYEELGEKLPQVDGARAAQKLITQFKNDLKRWFSGMEGQLPRQRALLSVFRAYQKRLQEQGRYDYEDMILFVLDRFTKDEELLAHYQEQFQYLLVDEYQDTNGAQNELLLALAAQHEEPNIFVVGDDKQSIYRFQGASLENMLAFHERYRDEATVVALKDNYRNQPTILAAAHGLIEHNATSLAQQFPELAGELIPTEEAEAQPIQLQVYATEAAEQVAVAQQVAGLVEQGVSPSEIAILTRRNREAAALVPALKKLDVPVQLTAGENVLEHPVVQQLLELLRYLAGTGDETYLARVLQYDWLGLAPLDVLKAQTYAKRTKQPLATVFSSAKHLQAAEVAQPAALTEWVERLADWRAQAVNEPLHNFLAQVLQESGLLAHYAQGAAEGEVLSYLRRVLVEAERLGRRQGATLSDWLEHLDLLTRHGIPLTARGEPTRAAVQVMTAHKAKGLEFEHVFIVHAANQRWGNLRERARLRLPAGLVQQHVPAVTQEDDERRLFYVAMTRAKQGLTISYAEESQAGQPQVPTQFVEELPLDTLERRTITLSNDEVITQQQLQLTPVPGADREEFRAYVGHLLDNYVMSPTHLQAYLTCPRQFYYKHVLRLPMVKTTHIVFGTAVHDALRDLLAEAQGGALPPATFLVKRFEQHLEREVLVEQDIEQSLAVGREVLMKYYRHYQRSLVTTVLVEYNFAPHHLGLNGMRLTGAIDKVEILDEGSGVARVVDYKTGRPDGKSAKLKKDGEYGRQLVFYKLLGDLSPRFLYQIQSGQIDFIRPNQRGKLVKKEFELTQDDTVVLTEVITRIWEEIMALRFLDPAVACGECEYCRPPKA